MQAEWKIHIESVDIQDKQSMDSLLHVMTEEGGE